jgi:hypothetical protein
MATKFEYYNTGDDLSSGFQAATWRAQTFTTVLSFTITSVKLLVFRKGSPGTVTVSIQGVDGSNKPDGSDITGLSITDDPSGYTTSSSGEWIEYIFPTPYTLSATTRYAIVIRTASGDADNRVSWRADSSSPTYTNGEILTSVDSGSNWTAVSSIDALFETWGNPLVPGKPTNPSPTDAVSSITLDETPLSWDASDPAADTYEVYFREQGDSWELVGTAQAGVEWTIEFGILTYGTTYEWRIDATNDTGTTTGDTWTFDTIDFDQIRVSYILLPGGAGAGHGPYDDPPGTEGTDWDWTGENNMLTIKRLVAAANDKIWHEVL